MKRKMLGVLLAVSMAASMLAGCGGEGTPAGNDPGAAGAEQGTGDQDSFGSGAGAEQQPDSGGAEGESGSEGSGGGTSYHLAANIWGSGAYALDIIVHADQIVAELAGMELDVADNQFTADKVITDLQSQMAAQPDGVIMMSVVGTVFAQVQQMCQQQNVPYVLDSNFPADEAVWESIQNDPLFVGGVSAKPYDMGYQLGEMAIANGNKTAAIFAAALGDYSHDQRILGFTEAFEAGGGTIQQVLHCTDSTEAPTKVNDLVAANQGVDCVYGTGGDFMEALATVKKNDNNVTFDVYGTDVNPDVISYVQEGIVAAMNGGNNVNGAIAMCLLINYLDGHQILGENGKAPVLDYLKCYTITAENADFFAELYANESCFVTEEQWKSLLYRFNPDVTLETYDTFLKEYADNVYALENK